MANLASLAGAAQVGIEDGAGEKFESTPL